MKIRRVILYLLQISMARLFSVYWSALAVGVGATPGYLMRDAGYKAKSPVEKQAKR